MINELLGQYLCGIIIVKIQGLLNLKDSDSIRKTKTKKFQMYLENVVYLVCKINFSINVQCFTHNRPSGLIIKAVETMALWLTISTIHTKQVHLQPLFINQKNVEISQPLTRPQIIFLLRLETDTPFEN